jgi:cytochrome P450
MNKDKAYDSGWDLYIGRFFDRGLMLLPDSGDHPRHRRIMQWAFTRSRLAGYVARMDELIADCIETWAEPAANGRFKFYPAMKQLSLDIATVMFMDGELGESADLLTAFQAAVHAGTAILRFPVPGLSWWKGLRGRAKLEEHFRAKLLAKRAADHDDLFAALCHAHSETGERFDDDDIVNHMIFLMMAAHDTSTVTATGAVYYLAKYPRWQERARAECAALGGGPLDIAALDSLTTLDMVVKETLRLVTSAPAIIRRTIRDTEIDGYHLPKGVIVTVMPGVHHRLEEYWTEPERFDPDRFIEPRREDKSRRHAYIPFGAGGHRCIGMNFGTYEVKLVLHHLLIRYRMAVRTDYELKWDKSALWFPPDGLPVTLEPRG